MGKPKAKDFIPVRLSDGLNFYEGVSGSLVVQVTASVTASVASVFESGSLTGLLVGGVALSAGNPVPVSDAGGSLTVDGSVTATLASGSITGLLVGGQPVAGTNPVPVSVSSATTVSGSVTGLLIGGVAAGSANPFPVAGNVATDQTDSGAPVKVGYRAFSASLPAPVGVSGQRKDSAADVLGRALVTHIPMAAQVWKAASYTTAQTGTSLWIPTSGSSIAITHLAISTSGTLGGRVTVWFGAGGDTAYSEGTDQPVIDAQFIPSATGHPGLILQPMTPIFGTGTSKTLKVTTDTAIAVRISVYGYEYLLTNV